MLATGCTMGDSCDGLATCFAGTKKDGDSSKSTWDCVWSALYCDDRRVMSPLARICGRGNDSNGAPDGEVRAFTVEILVFNDNSDI